MHLWGIEATNRKGWKGLTFVALLELPGDVPLHERRLPGAAVSDEDELEGGVVHGLDVRHSLRHSVHKHQSAISTREHHNRV